MTPKAPRHWTVALALGLLAGGASGAPPQAAEPSDSSLKLQIEAQPLREALNEFGRQSGLQVVFIYTDVDPALMAPDLRGTYSTRSALERLLANTSLVYEFINPRTVAVMRREEPRERAEATSAAMRASGYIRLAQSDAPSSSADLGHEGGVGSRDTGDAETGRSREVVEEIVVTGTHLPQLRPSSSAILQFSRDQIERTGATTVDDFLRKIPQNLPSLDATSFLELGSSPNEARGTGINLRGLGEGATLVLLNGQRLAPAGIDGSFIDVSMIPLSALGRVDVLTDGASAIYGADAVAGVVNFVLRQDFEGAETSVRYGVTTQGGARELNTAQLLGHHWGTGNALLVYDYADKKSMRAEDRDFIPPLPPPFDIVPAQERHGVIASGRQSLASIGTVTVDAYFGRRTYEQDHLQIPPGTPQHAYGEAKQYGANLSLRMPLSANWSTDVGVTYARAQEEALISDEFITGGQRGASRSEVVSGSWKLSGRAGTLRSGDVLASVGAEFRHETFDDLRRADISSGMGQDRDVRSAYVEVLLPLFGSAHSVSRGGRAELSLAARYDDYEKLGSSTSPKLGFHWSLTDALSVRGTYARAFRVPPLAQMSDRSKSYFFFPLPDPGAPGGTTVAAILGAPGNPSLTPEHSRSYSIGLDWQSQRIEGLQFAATYFDFEYEDRISSPPVIGSALDVLAQEATVGPIIDRTPDLAAIERDIATGAATLSDPFGIGVDNIQVLVDFRLHNLAASFVKGLDFDVTFGRQTRLGEVTAFLSGTRLTKYEFRAVDTAPDVSVLNTIFRPIDLRLRAGMSLAFGSFGSTLSLNYADSYQNNLREPVGTVASWTTFDLQLSYALGQGRQRVWSDGWRFVFNAQNLFDRNPPAVPPTPELSYNYGFDATNANPLGRLLSLTMTKAW